MPLCNNDFNAIAVFHKVPALRGLATWLLRNPAYGPRCCYWQQGRMVLTWGYGTVNRKRHEAMFLSYDGEAWSSHYMTNGRNDEVPLQYLVEQIQRCARDRAYTSAQGKVLLDEFMQCYAKVTLERACRDLNT
jgi:hypothetical protein